eukprot:363278-Chlamydomonas_euryale.AAC.4
MKESHMAIQNDRKSGSGGRVPWPGSRAVVCRRPLLNRRRTISSHAQHLVPYYTYGATASTYNSSRSTK